MKILSNDEWIKFKNLEKINTQLKRELEYSNKTIIKLENRNLELIKENKNLKEDLYMTNDMLHDKESTNRLLIERINEFHKEKEVK